MTFCSRCWRSSRMLLRLGGMCRSLALQFGTLAAPVCRQQTHAMGTWRSYMMRAPTAAAPHRSALLRCGFHTSSSLHKRRRDPEDEEFKQLLQSYREDLRKTPRPAVYLSLAGLVPVVLAPLTMILGGYYYPEMAYLQFTAAGCQLSFYGGIRWGMSFPDNSPLPPDSLNLGLGAALAFFGWTSLVLWDNLSASALMLIGGLVLAVCGGVGMLPPYPFWLGFLRGTCFLVIFCSVMVTLFLSAVYPEKSLKEQSPK